MKRSLFILPIILLMITQAGAQNRINGIVSDAQSGLRLINASVVIPETGFSCSTDDDGTFSCKNLSEGRYHICISFVGYRTDTLLINLGKKTDRYIECRLQPAVIDISTVTVSASRSSKGDKVPASIDVVNRQTIQQLPVVTIDDAFLLVPGLIASRNYGIYNKTGDIIIRGLNRNIQTLVLLDGIPYSLFDGSANIWNKMNVDGVDNVEVLKGPNSSLYGANAMAGVININTPKPQSPLSVKARIFFGTYNTQGGAINACGFRGKADKGFYWGASGFYRKSGGYIMAPDSIRDTNDVKTYLMEYSTSLKAGYNFGKNHSLEANWQYAYDNRGTGSRFFENEGSFNRYNSHFLRLSYHRTTAKSEIHINGFFKKDVYLKQNESVKSSGVYTFYNTHTNTRDGGLWGTWSHRMGKWNYLTTGIDYKSGATFSDDVYHTSVDTIQNNGKMDFAGIFVQDELSLLQNKLIILGSLRADWVHFYGGLFHIKSPTAATAFLTAYQNDFSDKNWFALSPKLGIKYIFSNNYHIYALYSSGFRPSNVSDISRTGDVSKGFKLANPDLKPERIQSLELGTGFRPLAWLQGQLSVFYSIGTDFQYFVATGDSVYTSGSNMKPMIRRQNVGRVDIAGIEAKLSIMPHKNISITAAYTFSHSQIKDYKTDSANNKDLTGNFLIEVPQHVAAGAFVWTNRIVNITLTGKFNDKEWIDDENTLQLDAYFTLDAKLQRTFYNRIGVALTVQNLLDKRYLDSKGLMSPGRFIVGEVSFTW